MYNLWGSETPSDKVGYELFTQSRASCNPPTRCMRIPFAWAFAALTLPWLCHELETWLALTLLVVAGGAFLWWLWGGGAE